MRMTDTQAFEGPGTHDPTRFLLGFAGDLFLDLARSLLFVSGPARRSSPAVSTLRKINKRRDVAHEAIV